MQTKTSYGEISILDVVYDNQSYLFPFSSREKFDRELCNQLKKSIAETGILVPIIVRANTLEGICGNHRFIAYIENILDQGLELATAKIPAILIDCDEPTAHLIGLVDNDIRENISEWEWFESLTRIYENNPSAVEKIYDIDGPVMKEIASWMYLFAFRDDINKKKQGAKPKLDREWIRIINNLLEDHVNLRHTFLIKLSDYDWVQNHTKESLKKEILENLRLEGVEFSRLCWNKHPGQTCLRGKYTWSEMINKLASDGSILLENCTLEGCCPYLQLDVAYTPTFIPSRKGKSYQLITEHEIRKYPPKTVDNCRVRGDYKQYFQRLDSYCIDPNVKGSDSCFARLELEAAQSVRDHLLSDGEPVILKSDIHQLPEKYVWNNPRKDENTLCTLDYCRKLNGSDSGGYRILIKPDDSRNTICINKKCGEYHQELLDTNDKQKRAVLFDMPKKLAEQVMERLFVHTCNESISIINPYVFGILESQLLPEWERETRMLIVQLWKKIIEMNIIDEEGIGGSNDKTEQVFLQKYPWFPKDPNRETIDFALTKIREDCFSLKDGRMKWIALLSLVKECVRYTKVTLDWEDRTMAFVERFTRDILKG